jgi:hypothetical protein
MDSADKINDFNKISASIRKKVGRIMSKGSMKTLLHDSRIGHALWSRNVGSEGQGTEKD